MLIHAKEAREKTDKIINEAIESEINLIKSKIEEAINDGNYEIILNNSKLYPRNMEMLKKLGYRVSRKITGVCEEAVQISWIKE